MHQKRFGGVPTAIGTPPRCKTGAQQDSDEKQGRTHCAPKNASRLPFGLRRVIVQSLIVLASIAAAVAIMAGVGALADRLHPFTACIVGGTVVVGALFLFAWREDS